MRKWLPWIVGFMVMALLVVWGIAGMVTDHAKRRNDTLTSCLRFFGEDR